MTKASLVSLIVALAAVASAVPVAAEERSRTWAGLGFGGATGHGGGAALLTGSLVHQRRNHYFALRGVAVADPFDESGDSSLELAALYGRSVRRRYAHAALATGLALTGIDPCRANDTGPCSTVGIPILAEVAVQPLPILGLGVQGVANLNPKASFVGVTLFLQVGWMP